ncbi:MAG: hypothetical protein K1X74_11755 [Pirellulales bacterium]|nr:hypothetical protein [Pirellulales bacterium]
MARTGWMVLAALAWSAASVAAEYEVGANTEKLPAGAVSDEIAGQLADAGWAVKTKKKVAVEFWPHKQWTAKEGFEASAEVLYPFEVGQLLGVMRYDREGTDFRGQTIKPGVYTVRYAQQPVDGNHVGTSDTRDFLLLLPVEDDKSGEKLAEEELWETSAKVAESTHPTMLCLLASTEAGGDAPAIVHDEDRELWSVRFANAAIAGGKVAPLTLTLVVVGQAAE